MKLRSCFRTILSNKKERNILQEAYTEKRSLNFLFVENRFEKNKRKKKKKRMHFKPFKMWLNIIEGNFKSD